MNIRRARVRAGSALVTVALGTLAIDCASKSVARSATIGDLCASNDECQNGICVDNVCCDTACNQSCHSCSQDLRRGHCTATNAGSDPRGDCRDDGVRTCGHDGTCDGAGNCRLYLSGTICEVGPCDGFAYAAKACDGVGQCTLDSSASCGNFRCSAARTCLDRCTTDADCVSPGICFRGSCGGLLGHYYDDADLSAIKFTRVDPVVDFSWPVGMSPVGMPVDGGASEDASIAVGTFSVSWTGTITPRFSEEYTFEVVSDDGARLYVAGAPLVDAWMPPHVATAAHGTILLSAGQKYPIQLTYWQREGRSTIRLSWLSRSEPSSIVPTTALLPSEPP